jgi:3-isopropylmalate/(R)-2-methylmalate dehydratase small subunit
MAIELDQKCIDRLFEDFSGDSAFVETDLPNRRLIVSSEKTRAEFVFSISEFDRALVEAGGWVEYADQKY